MKSWSGQFTLNLTEKALAFFLIVPVLFFVDGITPFYIFAVTGHAHFLLTSLYQYKSGRYPARAFISYAAMIVLFLLIAFQIKNAFTLIVALFFICHNFFDDMKLSGRDNTVQGTLTFAPILLTMGITTYQELYNAPNALYLLPCLVLALGMFAYNLFSRHTDFYTVYTSILSVVLVLILFYGVDYLKLWAYIILSHYINWYIKMGALFYRRMDKSFPQYLGHVAWCNGLFVALWFMLTLHPPLHFLFPYFFSPAGFYSFTLAHLVATVRKEDYRIFLKSRTA